MKKRLTDAETQFVAAFCQHLNPVLACEAMGLDGEEALNTAYELMAYEHVQEAIAARLLFIKRQKEYQRMINNISAADLGINNAWVIMRLKDVADRADNISHRLKAIELLGKAIGMFKDKAEDSPIKSTNAFSPEERKVLMSRIRGEGR